MLLKKGGIVLNLKSESDINKFKANGYKEIIKNEKQIKREIKK